MNIKEELLSFSCEEMVFSFINEFSCKIEKKEIGKKKMDLFNTGIGN